MCEHTKHHFRFIWQKNRWESAMDCWWCTEMKTNKRSESGATHLYLTKIFRWHCDRQIQTRLVSCVKEKRKIQKSKNRAPKTIRQMIPYGKLHFPLEILAFPLFLGQILWSHCVCTGSNIFFVTVCSTYTVCVRFNLSGAQFGMMTSSRRYHSIVGREKKTLHFLCLADGSDTR